MEKPDPADDEHESTPDSDFASIIETETNKGKRASKRKAENPDHKKSYRRSWRSASPLTKLMIYFTALIAVSTLIYSGFAGWQWYEIHSGAEETRRLAQAARDSADAAQKQANIAVDQLQALKDATQAARDSASAAKTAIDQNRVLVKAAQTQANTSQVSARAAERTASITQDTFRLVYRPSLGVDGGEITKFEAGSEIEGSIRFKNSGQTSAKNATVRTHFRTEPAGDISQPCPRIITQPLMSGLPSVSQVPIGGYKLANPHSFIKATAEDITRIESGQWWLYVYAIVRYEGPTGGQYFTSFYARWNPTRHTFDECDSNNEAN